MYHGVLVSSLPSLIPYRYPMCLHFLDLLQYEHFRKELVNSQCTKFIDDQQILHWQHYTRRRTQLLSGDVSPTPVGSTTPTV